MPTLRTDRLLLRPHTLADAPRVQELAGAREVADTTLTIPHPYPDGVAETWIGGLRPAWDERRMLVLAVTTVDDGLVGTVGLELKRKHDRGELVYWTGVPYWGRGYATEAAGAMVRYGFEELGFHRIYAGFFPRNPASGRVMEKLGMTYEGTLRAHLRKGDVFEDVAYYGMLFDEWAAASGRLPRD